jgi:hypothetical protein
MQSDEDSSIANIVAELRPSHSVSQSRRAPRYLARLRDESCIVNLAGNYNYLEHGYYASLDLEADGVDVHPTCKEALDAYVTPLMLEKARLHSVPVPEWYITNGYFEPPVIIDTINPFMTRHSIVEKPGHVDRVAKSMTRNFKYAMCCQEIPHEAKIGTFRAILGWSVVPAHRPLAEALWKIFRIPLSVVRIIQLDSEQVLLSDINPLPFESLNDRERFYLQKRVDHWLT